MQRTNRLAFRLVCVSAVLASFEAGLTGPSLIVPSPALAQDLFITDARIVDPEAREIRRGNLLIRDGRIAGSPDQAPSRFRGATLDAEGRWVIPGLVDLHTHSSGNVAPGRTFDAPGTRVIAQRMLYAGVTAFLDLFGFEDSLFVIREDLRAGRSVGADLFISGSCLTAPRGHCTEFGIPTRTMRSPAEARRHVADLAGKKADVIKLVYMPTGNWPSIDRMTFQAAVIAATEAGLPTVVHVATWQDVRDAIQVGASAVTHMPARRVIPGDLASLMAYRGLAIIPALAVDTDYREFVLDPGALDSPLARAITTPAIISAYRSAATREDVEASADFETARADMIFISVGEMARAGVTLLTGSDSGNRGTLQGYSEHRELMKLVEGGASTWQALAGATTLAGKLLGHDYGVNQGDEANLVILEASPIDDIRNTQKIFAVVHHGVVVDREALLR